MMFLYIGIIDFILVIAITAKLYSEEKDKQTLRANGLPPKRYHDVTDLDPIEMHLMNIEDLLPILMDGLKADGIRVGTPFFVKYGRVPTMDAVSEAVGAELTCVLLGERPGLAASDSMSAYITYGAYVGIPESKRTVVSNIHQHGIQPVEAGAYLVELLERILNEQKSGVDLQL